MNLCKDCVAREQCGNPNVTGCLSYTKQDENFLPINCYVCNASGRIAGNSYRHPSQCKRCNGTGEINYYTLTNEDFLKTATTEQLAEKLWEIYNAGKDDAKSYDTFEYFIDKEDVVEWLKEKHNGKNDM